MKISVLKYGGSSFSDLSQYNRLARELKQRVLLNQEKLVVVVSAMSGTTGKILEAGLMVDADLSPEVTDTLLGTGEIVSSCLLRAALDRIKVPSTQLSGYQLGMKTNSSHTRAKIVNFSSASLKKALEEHSVVVVAGGQGVSSDGQLTMLGRNSSDLSAVAIAATLGLDHCEIYSDVEGVYSADPYQIQDARLISKMSYRDIKSMSLNGAKVLHHGAVAYAEKYNVQIHCLKAFSSNGAGTIIGTGMPSPLICLNEKVRIYSFENKKEREVALSLAKKLERIVVEKGPYLIMAFNEASGMEDIFKEYELSYRCESELTHLSWMDEEGDIHHKVGPKEAMKTMAAQVHSEFHGKQEGEIRTKKRSNLSDVLVKF